VHAELAAATGEVHRLLKNTSVGWAEPAGSLFPVRSGDLAARQRGRQTMASRAKPDGLDRFQSLVAEHQSAIYRLAFRLTGNRDDAEDLVQESLIEAFQAFGRFRMGTHFDRWVYQIMTRTYIDKFTRRKRLEAVSLEEAAQGGDSAHLADSTTDPQEILETAEWSEPVQKALDQLPPEYRAVVVLCDAQGLSYEVASRLLGCPVGTVRSRLHRARDQLRALLRPSGAEGERLLKQ
jgi:RNA polymerase sigma-70 factor (ECF subfamily)